MPADTSGQRITWAQLPPGVVAAVEKGLGGRVVRAESQPGGFSEGLAARVETVGGRRAFVKAAGTAIAGFHRREIAVTRALPPEAPVPRLLDAYDDGTWVALIFEEVDGALPAQPWHHDDLARVLDAVTELAAALTPAPIDAGMLAAPRLGGWSALDASAAAAVSPWAGANLDRLVALEGAATLRGGTLLHGDLYPFNVMLARDRVWFVDWPHAWIGPPYADALTLLSSASLSGVDPEPLAAAHSLTRDAEPAEIDAFLAAHAGFLARLVATVGSTVDPALTGMATALARASLGWLERRLTPKGG